jgi:hypothetical protein
LPIAQRRRHLRRFANPYRNINPFIKQINETVREGHADINLRMVLAKGYQSRHDAQPAIGVRHSQPQPPGRNTALRRQYRFRLRQLFHNANAGLVIRMSGVGQFQASGRPLQQR